MQTGAGIGLQRSALVLYATETGNAHDVAEELGRILDRLRFSTRVIEFDDVGLKELFHYRLVLFVISTTGQGELPANAQRFWRLLRSVKLRPGSLQQLQFVSFGLGDSSYPQFNYAHRKLFNRLLQLGAQPLQERGESDEQHPEGIDGTFVPWSTGLKQRLLDLFPLPNDLEAIADDVLLPPKWRLDIAATQSEIPPTNGIDVVLDNIEDRVPSTDLLAIRNSIPLTLEDINRVTPLNHWQDVRHLTFVTEAKHDYLPGDVLTIYPKNFPSDVQAFIDLYNWNDVADSPLRLESNAGDLDAATHSPLRHFDIPSIQLTLRYLLTNVLDIMAIPRRSFFSRIAHYSADEFQRDRLFEFINPEYIDELYDYTTRPRRSILEVLQEFDTVKLPWEHLLDILPVMRGRQFSIASGGRLKEATSGGTRFELLIAIVKYSTVIKRLRQGVCTRYIASFKPGQQLSVKLQRGGLNITDMDIDKPVVMIGPGTGVAPIRALIYERLARREQTAHSGRSAEEQLSSHEQVRDMLFFGCRNRYKDYFFRLEWPALQADGVLDVHTACSRDQRQKVYVQDLIREKSQEVYKRLTHGIVYVCGSSGKMPQAVRQALVEVFKKEGNIEQESAEAELVRMEKEGRYKQETW